MAKNKIRKNPMLHDLHQFIPFFNHILTYIKSFNLETFILNQIKILKKDEGKARSFFFRYCSY